MITLVLSFVLALFASWYVLSPVLEGAESGDSQASFSRASLDLASLDLKLERERLFFRLEELEQDKTLGRVSEHGYQISKQEIVSELSVCLERLGTVNTCTVDTCTAGTSNQQATNGKKK